MDNIKIGKFIAENRKKKNLTQEKLAEKLGVTSKTISRWENGNYMPDISLLKLLSEELDISLNDLLSGEKVHKEQYQKSLEENILNTIEYTTRKIREKNNLIEILLIVFGIICAITAMTIFPSESSWGSVYSIIGIMISFIGIYKFTKRFRVWQRILFNVSYVVLFLTLLIIIDYLSVINIKQAPRFSYYKDYMNNLIEYRAPFYKVYRINYDTKNEYYIIDTQNKYNVNTVPVVPFNREKSGIDNIIKYKNKYIGNNSNIYNLLNSLPLSEFSFLIEIDPEKLGLTVDYHITDWYINDDLYLEKALIYNSVVIFSLIDNVEYINYNFTGKSYRINREKIKKYYPNYNDINTKEIDNNNFNKYLENKMNDDEFVQNVFEKLF